MNERNKIIYGSVFTVFLISLVILFALYNEGILTKKTYTNDLLGYEINIPRGYRLGDIYMKLMSENNPSSIQITSSSTYSVNNSEIVVLTKQNKTTEQKYTDILRQNQNLSMEQFCDCIVISTNLMPEAMANLINERSVKDGATKKSGQVELSDGSMLPIYENELAESYLNNRNQVEQRLLDEKRELVTLFLKEPKDFILKNKYSDDNSVTVYGLNISRFTGENQTASLQIIVDGISY